MIRVYIFFISLLVLFASPEIFRAENFNISANVSDKMNNDSEEKFFNDILNLDGHDRAKYFHEHYQEVMNKKNWVSTLKSNDLFKQECSCDYSKISISDSCPSDVGLSWEEYAARLFQARGLSFYGRLDLSLNSLVELLITVLKGHGGFHVGFECPLAITSTYFSIAYLLGIQGRVRRAQAMLMMGFIFVRDRGFSECTPWPVQGWDMLLAARNLREAVTHLDDEAYFDSNVTKSLRSLPAHFHPSSFYPDTNDERIKSLSLTPPSNFIINRSPQRSNIAIVSICAYGDEEPVRLFSTENHKIYSTLHGYDLHQYVDKSEIFPFNNSLKGQSMNVEGRKPFFWKVNAVRNAMSMLADDSGDENILQKPRYDWIFWMDCDAFFMDPHRTLESVIATYSAKSKNPPELFITVDTTGINNGVWLMRNSEWSRNFLQRWWDSPILQGRGANHNCSDQSTMQYELLYERSLDGFLDHGAHLKDENKQSIWPEQVRVVRQEHIQSFHQATAQSVLSREWADGDFIKHHPGCHYYKVPCQWMYQDASNFFKGKVNELLNSARVND